jgi:COP9 signalosome complex subunit 2
VAPRLPRRNEIGTFEKILLRNKRAILGDDFIQLYMADVLKSIRTQVLLKLIRPYTRIRLAFISASLNVEMAEVESLLISLILDGQVNGQIDQLEELLILAKSQKGAKKYQSLDKWSGQLGNLHTAVFNKLA